MRMIRNYSGAKNEIALITGELQEFVTFHRRKIQDFVTTVVTEGHRGAVKQELRQSSNECPIPLLELT